LTGAALGAAAAMLIAPKPGSDMRQDLADRLGDLGQTAKDRWGHMADVAASAMHQGREAYDQAREAVQEATVSVAKSTDGVKRAVKDVTDVVSAETSSRLVGTASAGRVTRS
jgi:gas vesicle protein